MVKVILLVLLGIFILGFSYYLKEFKKLLKDFKQFVKITYAALDDDGKIDKEEKEEILKEIDDMRIHYKNIKVRFLKDVKKLGDLLDDILGKAKNKIRK